MMTGAQKPVQLTVVKLIIVGDTWTDIKSLATGMRLLFCCMSLSVVG